MEERETEVKIMRQVSPERLLKNGARHGGERKIVDRYMLVPSTGKVVKVRWQDGLFQVIYKSDDVSKDMTKDRMEDSLKLAYGDNPLKMLQEEFGARKVFDVPKLRREFEYDGMKVHTERVFELGPVFEVEFQDKRRMLDFVSLLGYGERNFEKRSVFKMLRKYYKVQIEDGTVYVDGSPTKRFEKVQSLPPAVYSKVLGRGGMEALGIAQNGRAYF